MTEKQQGPVKPIDPEKLDLIINKIVELSETFGDTLNAEHIIEILDIVATADDDFYKGTTQEDGFITIADIEQLISEELRRIHDATLKNLLRGMKKIQGESSIIDKKKIYLKEKGIKVKNWRYYTNSILTLVGRVPYERLALRASTTEDEKKLKQIGIKGYVYPIDETLGISQLPFNITIGAMLKIAKEACRSNSFEDAQERLKEFGIDINDDTIRTVTNTIGALVFENEKKAATIAYSAFTNRTLSFPVNKIPHILYLEVDGSMVPTQKQQRNDNTTQDDSIHKKYYSKNPTDLNYEK